MDTNKFFTLTQLISVGILGVINTATAAPASKQSHSLEEVTVTAQKRKQSLQDTPIAISALNDKQLVELNISSLDTLGNGAIPSLRILPSGNTPSTLVMTIRGNGPLDISQTTREGSVAVYMDGFYLGRSQGLGNEWADLERIEVLRGPQGTLFGRNATGGTVSLTSKKPSGKFGLKQIVSVGNYDAFRSVTHIDFPETYGVNAKIDYFHSERDGWVKNPAPGSANYNEYNKDGGRLSLNSNISDTVSIDYVYENSKIDVTQNYFQLSEDTLGLIGVESGRQSRTRFSDTQLEPTETTQQSHALTVAWDISDKLTMKSLTSYRELDEDVSNNWNGTLYFNGLVVEVDIEQEQWTQEFQLIGTHDRLEWVAGIYSFKEEVKDNLQNTFTLDSFGLITGTPNTAIPQTTIFTTLQPNTNTIISFPWQGRQVQADTESAAVYGHATFTPPILDDKLELSLGLRYTQDEKSGDRMEGTFRRFNEDWEHINGSITANYNWTDNLSSYLTWGTAYKAGGVNARSENFTPYDEEDVETIEIGTKYEFWGQRARLNAALFSTDYNDMQIDVNNPANVTLSETINARNKVEVSGAEVDLTISALQGLVVNLSYTYLDGDIPLQPNSFEGGALKQLYLSQTPQHAGALSMDYTFKPWSVGTLSLHLDATSTDRYDYVAFGNQRQDSYTLFNAKITMANIKFSQNSGELKLSAWGKNLADEEYVVFAFPVSDPAISVVQAFGDPRTYGIDATYQF